MNKTTQKYPVVTSLKESNTQPSENSNEVIMTLETPERGERCYNAPRCCWK